MLERVYISKDCYFITKTVYIVHVCSSNTDKLFVSNHREQGVLSITEMSSHLQDIHVNGYFCKVLWI